MFDFAWSEIALISGVALLLIGPKDLPIAVKAITTMVKKARRMAAEFQTHVDDMVKDADLHEVRDSIREIRGLDIRGTLARAVDRDGSIRSALKDPVREPPPVVTTPVESYPDHGIATPADSMAATPSQTPALDAPAFVPPDFVPKMIPEPAPVPVAPAFIPPEAAQHGAAAPHSSGV